MAADAEHIENRVRRQIAEIAASKRSVRERDIEAVLNELRKLGHAVTPFPHKHGIRYWIDKVATFSICLHHKGRSEILQCYVNDFLKAMDTLGYYGDDDGA